MKKILFIQIALISFLSQTCQEHKTEVIHSVQVNVLGDITDVHYVLPIAEPIQKLYDFDVDKNTEGFFRISTITDKHLNPAIEYHLLPGFVTEKNNTLDDPYYRERLVRSFYDSIKNAISNFDAKCLLDSSLKFTECFNTIAGELQLMKNSKAEKHILLVFSDLQENSDLFNCYSKANQELLRKQPDTVIELFNQTQLLPENLLGFNIFFIYQPINRQSDKSFEAMVEIYKKLLVSRGASVKIQADNNYLN